ncbi:TlpA disulfide reductase family protein [Aquincola sp. MAHUQ-54]|uniref:TlpA disulfide reductase family protein n=1 Tax=Aquincola agrisoli TaxID=3119538 RepID=A0AAW9QI72_9BURK
MNRRTTLFAGVAAAAAAAGAGFAWWRLQPGPVSAEAGALWNLRFAQPDGGELVMASLRGQPLVLNFWATWCPPCVKELPQIDRFHRDFSGQGWRVVGLAVDGPTPVREFLRRQPLGFPVGLAGLEGTDLSRQLGNSTGALPFTVVFDRQGRPTRRKLGETSYEELAAWANA